MKRAYSVAKTRWHRLLGKLLEETLTPVGITVYTEFPLMSEPPEADILLLRRSGSAWTAAQRARLPDGVRDISASHVLLEFKYTESVNDRAVRQALAYDTFYKRAQKLEDDQVQTFLLSSKTPNERFLAEFGYRRAAQSGVYYSAYKLVQLVPLLALNELSNATHNSFVRLFASRRQQKFAAYSALYRSPIDQLPEKVWQYLVGLRSYWSIPMEETMKRKEAEELEGLTPEDVLAMGREIEESLLAVLSPEKRLAGITARDIWSYFKPEELLARLAPEQRLAGLAPEQRLAGLSMEEIEAYLHQLRLNQKRTNEPNQ